MFRTDKDPVLVVRLNPNWVRIYQQPAADDVLNAIATFRMRRGQRRDEGVLILYCVSFESADSLNFMFNLLFALGKASLFSFCYYGRY